MSPFLRPLARASRRVRPFRLVFHCASAGWPFFPGAGHLAVMHLVNSIDTVDYAFVAARATPPFWRTYDGFLLVLALLRVQRAAGHRARLFVGASGSPFNGRQGSCVWR